MNILFLPVREDSNHLRSISQEERPPAFASDNFAQSSKDAGMAIVLVLALQKDLDAVQGGHRRLGHHASYA